MPASSKIGDEKNTRHGAIPDVKSFDITCMSEVEGIPTALPLISLTIWNPAPNFRAIFVATGLVVLQNGLALSASSACIIMRPPLLIYSAKISYSASSKS